MLHRILYVDAIPSDDQDFLIVRNRAFDIQRPPICLDCFFIGFDVYSAILLEYFVLRELVQRGSILNISRRDIETSYDV